MITRRQALLATALAGSVPRFAAAADVTRTTMLVGFSAGGGLDAVTRILAESLQAEWHRTVIVENKPGAAGALAVQQIRRSPPDGSVLMTAPIAVPVLNPVVYPAEGQAFGVDYLPVAQLTSGEFALIVAADHPARTPAEFFKWVRSSAKNTNFGIATLGNLGHLLGIKMGRELSVELVPIGYKGAGNMLPDVVGGVVGFAITQESDVTPLVTAGKLRKIMTFGKTRSDQSPQIPTALESGLNVSGSTWYAVFAPPGTPEPLLASMAKDISRVLSEPAVQSKFRALGSRPTPGVDHKALGALIAADIATLQPVARAAGLQSAK